MATLEELFARFCRSGDAAAFGEIYDRTAAQLLRTALHVSGSAAAAEDAVQATFLAALEQRANYDDQRPLMPWLLGILANQARAARRRDQRAPDPGRLTPDLPADPAQQAAAQEFHAELDEAIARLPEATQPVLVLHLRHGMAPADIAHALRRPPGTVRAQLSRGLEKLRTILPASIASALALTASASAAQGLTAVKTIVMAKAMTVGSGAVAAGATATGTSTLLLGALAMNKLALGTVAAAAAVTALWLAPVWSSAGDDDLAPPPAVAATPASAATATAPDNTTPPAPPEDPDPTAARARVASPAEPPIEPVLEEPPPEAPPGALRGRVIWAADDGPAAGVTVVCRDHGQVPTHYEMTTDAAGRFAFAEIPDGLYHLTSDRGGETKRGKFPSTLTDPEIVLRIPPGCDVRGVVVDDAQNPIEGAAIWLSDRHVVERGRRVAVTDRDGRFTVRSVGPERFIGARARGFAPSIVRYVQAETGEQVDLPITLRRGDARIHGRAFDANGNAVAHASVRIAPPGTPEHASSAGGAITRSWAPATARTRDDGSFDLAGLPPGTLTVQVRAPGHGAFRTELSVAAGSEASVTANLPAGGAVTGQVRTADGSPLGDQVTIYSGTQWDDFSRSQTITNATGMFALRDITPGTVQMNVYLGSRIVLREEILVAPGQTVHWDPVLQMRLDLTGTVVDAAQRPLADWTVYVMQDDKYVGHAKTNEEGRFTVEDLDVQEYEVRVSHEPTAERRLYQNALTALIIEDVIPASTPLHIEIGADDLPSCSVIGRVLGADGTVVPQTRVNIGHMNGKGVVALRVDAETGEFAVADILPGPYWITVRAEGYPWIEVGRRELAPGEELDLGTLELRQGTIVTGRLVTRTAIDEALLDSMEVKIFNEQHRPAGVIADRSNRGFRTSPLEPGTYRVQVKGPGIATVSQVFEIVDGVDATVDVPVQAGARRQLRAHLPTGAEPPAWVWVSVLQGNRSLEGRQLELQKDGSYRCEVWLAPGEYLAWFGTDGNTWHAQHPLVIDPALGEAPVADVTLEKRK